MSAVATNRWLRRPEPDTAADRAPVRLVCCPHAGGSASYYRPLATACGRDLDVVVVQYPGRQDRWSDPPAGSVAELADAVAAEVEATADRPVALFGHSLGASVAFEVARRLSARGRPPEHLFASGCRAPGEAHDRGIHRLDDAAFLREVVAAGGTDDALLREPELLELLLPMLRSDYRAAETYRWAGGPRLPTPVTALLGEADPTVPVGSALSWEAVTDGRFALHTFPGDHFYVLGHVHGVADVVRAGLSVPPRR